MQMEDMENVQDIDIARFVPKEVDNAGITVASADRFSARVPPLNDTDGELLYILQPMALVSVEYLHDTVLYKCFLNTKEDILES